MSFAKRNVSFCSLLTKCTTTKFAFHHSCLLSFVNDSFFLLSHLSTFSIDFKSSPESDGLSFPFGHILFFLLNYFFLLYFFFYDFSLFHEFFLFFGDDSLFLDIEFGSFILEDFFAYFLMFGNAVRIELSTAALSAHDEGRWIILFDLKLGVWFLFLIVVARGLLISIFRGRRFNESILGWYSWIGIRVLLRLWLIQFRLCFRHFLLVPSLLSLVVPPLLSLVIASVLVVDNVTTSLYIFIIATVCVWLLLIVRVSLIVWSRVLVIFIIIWVSWLHFVHWILVVVYN